MMGNKNDTFENKFVNAQRHFYNIEITNAVIECCIKSKLILRIDAENNSSLKQELDNLIRINLSVFDLLLGSDKEVYKATTFQEYQLEKNIVIESIIKEISKKMFASIHLNEK
jgi:hypothetical protein